MKILSEDIISEIKHCQVCAECLPLPPKPIIQFSVNARLLIIGQAPGIKAHQLNRPFDDPSGVRLREWLRLSEAVFYDAKRVALMPMGFCYPGKGKSGDLPPRPECAPLWHPKLNAQLTSPALTLLVGSYAQQYYLQDNLTLTERVRQWRRYSDNYLVLPHPSPRNNIWLKRNDWFETEVLPQYQQRIAAVLTSHFG